MDLILIYFSLKYKGYFQDIYRALKEKEIAPIEELRKIKMMIDNNEIKAITIVDDDYPDNLKKISNPPFVLFYEGNINLIKDKSFVFTGDFNSENIEKFIFKSSKEISKTHSLISCDVKPLDKLIINSFLDNNKNVIIVLANGINNQYEFKKNNLLVLSECPSNTTLNIKRIHQRNRIATGLSEGIIITSSCKNSWIMNLVSYGLEQGKEIFCYPGLQTENDGNNILIQEGANLITSIESLINNKN